MMGYLSLPHRPITRLDRLTSSNSILTRLLAIVGIIFLIERTASFFSSRASFSSVTNHHVTLGSEHILSYDNENSGLIKETGETKAIIVASTTWENTSWIHEHFSDWNLNIYVVNNATAPLTVLHRAGNEASVFLTYLITHYYALPSYMLFHHAGRYQWHNDNPMYDAVPVIQSLRLSHVKRVGYASLRCAWEPGCPAEMRPTLGDERAEDDPWGKRNAYAEAWGELFPGAKVPDTVAAPCCAQFAVTREQVLKTPVEVFERVRQWLWGVDLDPSISGRVMEYLWHILFSMPLVSCPDTQTCYCEMFGLCDLTCPDAGFCEGRWWNPGYLEEFPKGWPEEGQGERGFPEFGWWWDVYPGENWGLEGTDMRNRLRAGEESVGAVGKGMSDEELREKEEDLRMLMEKGVVDAELGSTDATQEMIDVDEDDHPDIDSGAAAPDLEVGNVAAEHELDTFSGPEQGLAVDSSKGENDDLKSTMEDYLRKVEEDMARKTAAGDDMFEK